LPSVDRALRPKILEAYLKLDAFADARAAIAALKTRGLRTAILSNGSPRMLGAAVEASGLAPLLDAVFSVDAVRAYKPRPEAYALVTDSFGVKPDEVVFVSSNRLGCDGSGGIRLSSALGQPRAPADEYSEHAALRSCPIFRRCNRWRSSRSFMRRNLCAQCDRLCRGWF